MWTHSVTTEMKPIRQQIRPVLIFETVRVTLLVTQLYLLLYRQLSSRISYKRNQVRFHKSNEKIKLKKFKILTNTKTNNICIVIIIIIPTDRLLYMLHGKRAI